MGLSVSKRGWRANVVMLCVRHGCGDVAKCVYEFCGYGGVGAVGMGMR